MKYITVSLKYNLFHVIIIMILEYLISFWLLVLLFVMILMLL